MRDIEKYSKDFFNETFETVQARYRYRKVLEILREFSPKRLVEIGCGHRSVASIYSEYEECLTIEPATDFYNLAQSGSFPRHRMIKGFFEDCSKEVLEFNPDFILCSSLLHEVSDPGLLLQRIRETCNAGTTVHINVPNCRSLHLLWAYGAKMIKSIGVQTERAKVLQQTTTFDLPSLVRLVEDADFQIISKGSYFIKPFNHAKMGHLVKAGLLDEALLDGLYALTSLIEDDIGSEIFVNCCVK